MSADTRPITPTRFSVAIKELGPSTLRLKLLEICNSITHLEYSNFQLKPYAEGSETSLSLPTTTSSKAAPVPDQDCINAIRENKAVIARMQERVELIRGEVEERGLSWEDFDTRRKRDDDDDDDEKVKRGDEEEDNEAVERTPAANGNGPRHAAWGDGTFQTGVIRNGEVQLDQDMPLQSASAASAAPSGQQRGGTLGDEALRLAMEERMRELGDTEDGGVHL